MNSVLKLVTKIIELNQPHVKCDGTQHTKVRLRVREVLKEKWKNKVMQGKGKSVPLQAWSGPEGSRKLRFPEFMTTAQEGGKVVSFTHQPHLHPGNSSGTHFR